MEEPPTEKQIISGIIEADDAISLQFVSLVRRSDNVSQSINAIRNELNNCERLLRNAESYIQEDIIQLLKMHFQISKFAIDLDTNESKTREANRRTFVTLRRFFLPGKTPAVDQGAPQSIWTEIRSTSVAKKSKKPSAYFSIKTALLAALGKTKANAVKTILSLYDPSAYLSLENSFFIARAFEQSLMERPTLQTIATQFVTSAFKSFDSVYLFLHHLLTRFSSDEERTQVTNAIQYFETNFTDECKRVIQTSKPSLWNILLRRHMPVLPSLLPVSRTFYRIVNESNTRNIMTQIEIAYQQSSPVFPFLLWAKISSRDSDDIFNRNKPELLQKCLLHDFEIVSPLVTAMDQTDQVLLRIGNEYNTNPNRNYAWYASTTSELATSVTHLKRLNSSIHIRDTVYHVDANMERGDPMDITSGSIMALILFAEDSISFLLAELASRCHL